MKGVRPFAASAVDRVHLAATGSRKALDSTVTGSRKALTAAATSVAGISATAQGLLASALASDLNGMLASMAKGPATIYDRAMDAEYLATHTGGGNHRLFDGGHTGRATRVPANKKKDPRYAGIYRDMPRYSGIRGYPFNRSNPDPQLSKGDLRVGAPGSAGVRG